MESAPSIICCHQNIHLRELILRLQWSVHLRWFFIVATSLLALISPYLREWLTIEPLLPSLASLFLFIANSIFYRRIKRLESHCLDSRRVKGILLQQIVVDYFSLSLIVYALGSIETPALFLIIPNMILATLFFSRWQSLMIAVAGVVTTLTPWLLESMGLIPTVSIFADGLKAQLMAHPFFLTSLLISYLMTVLVSWYLATHITSSLIKNEIDLEENYQHLLLLDEEKSRTTLRATHEIKAPLAAIKSYIFTLRDGYAGELPVQAQQIVIRIGHRCDLLLEKITDIIRLSNLKSYVVSDQYHPLDMGAILNQRIAHIEESGNSNMVTLNYHYRCQADERLMVEATEEHLQTLFDNLLSNAINYSHKQGVVDIVLTCRQGCATLRVGDHGIGIPTEVQAAIFTDHYRAANAVRHHQWGSGLGLPIVREIVRLLKGDLEIHSKEGEGTAVELSIPLMIQKEK